jgi:hypothetical protein
MNNEILEFLQPDTLVAIIADIAELETGWLADPAGAPPEDVQQALRRLAEAAGQSGHRLLGADFDIELAREKESRVESDWLEARNARDRANWFEDYL